MSVQQVFYNFADNTFNIHIIIDKKKVFWFKITDIAVIFRYTNFGKMILKHVATSNRVYWEQLGQQNNISSFWHPRSVFINEAGLNELAWKSKQSKFKNFHNWLVNNILPSILQNEMSPWKTMCYHLIDLHYQDKENIQRLFNIIKQQNDIIERKTNF